MVSRGLLALRESETAWRARAKECAPPAKYFHHDLNGPGRQTTAMGASRVTIPISASISLSRPVSTLPFSRMLFYVGEGE